MLQSFQTLVLLPKLYSCYPSSRFDFMVEGLPETTLLCSWSIFWLSIYAKHSKTHLPVPMKEPTRLIRIENPRECRIIERRNRFVVLIELRDGTVYRAHLTNTGRLLEFLVKGQKAFYFKTQQQHHHRGKTDCRLFAIADHGLGALIDTWLQMKSFEEALQRNLIPWLAGCRMRKRNAALGASRSRIDYLLDCHGKQVYLEVKSAVLRDGAYAMYPDCPTERGRKHVRELTNYVRAGGTGIVVFMAALPYVRAFTPNRAADPKLSDALVVARSSGVDIRAIGLYYNPDDGWVYLFEPDLAVRLLQIDGIIASLLP
jgi:sugar fermentation stimulation protein A